MANKIGRNDPCPCGSGKKYKKCCIDFEGEIRQITDIGSLWNIKYIESNFSNQYSAELHNTRFSLINDTLKKLGISSLSDVDDGEMFLTVYLTVTEEAMKQLIVNRTIHELLFWTRRISPTNEFERVDETILLYREVLNCAIMKYGQLEDNFDTIIENGRTACRPNYIHGISPISDEITNEIASVLHDCYLLEFMALLFIEATQQYRCLIKGGKFTQTDKGLFFVDLDDATEYLVNLYDKRARYSGILSKTGTLVDAETRGRLFSISYQVNAGHRIKVPIIHEGRRQPPFPSNYIPFPIYLEDYYQYMSLFEEEFFHEYGFSTHVFISFISVFSKSNLLKYTTDLAYQYSMLQRAYFIVTDESLELIADETSISYEDYFGDKYPGDIREEINNLFKYMELNVENREDIDLWTRGPRKLYIPFNIKKRYIVDYSSITSILQTIMLPISRLSGHTGNKRAIHFEQQTVDKIYNIYGEESTWVMRARIHNAKGEEKEIDASFCIGSCLFIVECKSVNVSFSFDMGDKKSIDYRRKKNEEAIAEVKDKIRFISNDFNSINPNLPQGTKYLFPIVISPYPEYIWSRDNELFVKDDLPVICTLEELGKIKGIELDEILSNPNTIELK